MGPEAVAAFQAAAPYIFAGGTAASMYGQDQQAKQQKRILNNAMLQNAADQDKGAAQVLDEGRQMSPQARQQAMAEQEAAAMSQATKDLGGATLDTAQSVGGSRAFVQAKADRALEEGERATAVARELSKIRAPGMTTANESMRRSALAEQIGSMWSGSRQRSQAAQQDASSVGMPGIGQLGQVAQIIGGAGMMLPAGGAAAGAGGGATNAALAESAVGTAGYGASSATPAAVSPMWKAAPAAFSMFGKPRRQMAYGGR